MAINKVIYGADTLVDLTEDTVTAEDVLNSKSFHTPDGVKRTGTASYPVTDVQVNGTSVMDGTVAKVEQPTAEVKTATDTFTTVNGGLLQKCVVDLEPVQSGSGDPYPAGGGKNKLPMSVGGIKAVNTSGTWSGNSYLLNNVTYKILLDNSSNILGINIDTNGGTASADSILYLANGTSQYFSLTQGGSYILTADGATSNVGVRLGNSSDSLVGQARPTALTFTADSSNTARIGVNNGLSVNNLTIRPMIRLATETDPTFAPYSNVRPISGHTEVDLYNVGKNKFDYTQAAVSQRINISNGTTENANSEFKASPYIAVEVGESYTLNFVYFSAANYGMAFYDSNKNYLSGQKQRTNDGDTSFTFVVPIGAKYIRFTVNASIELTAVQLEKGSVVTSFEPYLGHLYQVQIGSTVYGGYVDLVSGVMTATWAEVDLGTLGWAYNSSRARFEANISGIKYDADRNHLIMPNYKFFQGSPNDMPDFNYTCSNNSTGIYVKNSLYGNDTASFIVSMTGYIGVYELATPLTIQLTPQQIEALVGENNLSTPLDGQSIDSVEYREVFAFDDVEKVVSLRVPISMLGADESGRTTASQAYASGDYFYKDGYMCKALTSISAGATLTLNTNYSQGTLADILKAIKNA